ncbi:hypothetical protein PFDG_04602, partial [Plasmodium falciparum Dd2]
RKYFINQSRLYAQRYLYNYNEVQPVSQLVVQICDIKQSYTQYGGLRPYGVSFLIGGYDTKDGYQLYHTDPSGNYSGWFATAIGTNNLTASSVLKQVIYIYINTYIYIIEIILMF